jgi:hypothetical protein
MKLRILILSPLTVAVVTAVLLFACLGGALLLEAAR